jgi:hypothetical protein
MPLDDLEMLHEIMSNKYERQRVPYEQVLEVEAMIKAAKSSG